MNTQKGFSPIIVVVLVAVVAVAGFVGWRVYDSSKPAEQATVSDSVAKTKTEAAQTPVESVDTAVKEVDAIVTDDSTAGELDAQLDY